MFLIGNIEKIKANPASIRDGEYIADMVIPLTLDEARERIARFGATRLTIVNPKHDGSYATCRHWDEDTGLCKAYDQRPAVCREYPRGQNCMPPD